MSRDDRETDRRDLVRVNVLFDDVLDLIEHSDAIVADPQAQVPSVSIASLMDQCEAMVEAPAHAAEGPVYIVYTIAGVDAAKPDWWYDRFRGLAVRRVVAADLDDVGFRGWLAAHRAAGIPVVVLADVAAGPITGLKVDKTQVAVCHPYRAFHALPHGDVQTLDGFCGALVSDLNLQADGVVAQMDMLEDPGRHLALELEFPASVVVLTPPVAAAPQTAGVGDIPAGLRVGEPYHQACADLGYDPVALPGPLVGSGGVTGPASYHVDTAGSYRSGPAIVSAFLQQAAQIRQTMAPHMGPLNATVVVTTLDRCLAGGEGDFQNRFDDVVDQLNRIDQALCWLGAAAHFHNTGDRLAALSFANHGLLAAPAECPWLRVLAAAQFCAFNDFASAFTALSSYAMVPGVLSDDLAGKLSAEIATRFNQSTTEHGHSVLLSALMAHPPIVEGRTPVLIEIGTTREVVAGQASTQKLAEACNLLGIDFITVDMDPRNTLHAQRMFQRTGLKGQAITSKGEDYLAAYDGPIDYVFLDAYDFDHGKHSDARQSRYEQYLGGRIDEEQCHQMHLECAQSLVEKLSPNGLICFDDTWTLDDGGWAAKGTTAVPYLLENGFVVVEKRSNAALLKRG